MNLGVADRAGCGHTGNVYGPNTDKTGFARGGIGFLTRPLSDRARRVPEAGGGLFSTTHDVLRYGRMLANDGSCLQFAGGCSWTGWIALRPPVRCPAIHSRRSRT